MLPNLGVAGMPPAKITGSKQTGVPPEHSFPVPPHTQMLLLQTLEVSGLHIMPPQVNSEVDES